MGARVMLMSSQQTRRHYLQHIEMHAAALRTYVYALCHVDYMADSALLYEGRHRNVELTGCYITTFFDGWEEGLAELIRAIRQEINLLDYFTISHCTASYENSSSVLKSQLDYYHRDYLSTALGSGLPTFEELIEVVEIQSFQAKRAFTNLQNAFVWEAFQRETSTVLQTTFAQDLVAESQGSREDLRIAVSEIEDLKSRVRELESEIADVKLRQKALDAPIGARELALRLGVPKSTLLRHVAQLRQRPGFKPLETEKQNGMMLFAPEQQAQIQKHIRDNRRETRPVKTR